MLNTTGLSVQKSNFWIALLVLFSFPISGLAQFTDDFSDGDFTSGVVWSGDDSIFDASANDLHLDAFPVTSEAYMSTPCQAIENASWEFFVNMDFGTSGSNLSRVYLVSDQSNLRGSLNGYFVEIGGGDDKVSLRVQSGTSSTEIISGIDDYVSTDPVLVKVQVTRDATGNWEVLADTTAGFTNYVSQGVVFDDTHVQSYYFGVLCDYTSTRSDLFWFDDFVVTGSPFQDTIAPTLSNLVVTGQNTLDVYFSEPMLQTPAEVEGNYPTDNGLGTPTSAVLDGSNNALVHLTYGSNFQNGITNTLTIVNVQDLATNSIGTASGTFIYAVADSATYRDIVINEIMADPTPTQGLPDADYIELYNAGTGIYDLGGWTISDGVSTGTIGSRLLLPGQYVVLVASGDSATFQNNVTPNTTGVSSFPSFNISDDPVYLRDHNGALIDFVHYYDSWYQDPAREDGGYSLEMINPELPCTNAFNWIVTNDIDGGTPGAQNSVYDLTPDQTAPTLTNVFVIDSDTLEVVFSETLDSLDITAATYTITPSLTVSNIIPIGPEFVRARVVVSPSLTAGQVHTLSVGAVADCSGNQIATNATQFALPEQPVAGDIIINEVLFDPGDGGQDFVEIYNNSDKILSLENWTLANFDDDTIDNQKVITEEAFLFFPQEYLVLTRDVSYVRTTWLGSASADRFIEMESFPTYSNDSSTVYLINNLDTVSDAFSYNDDMHFPLLNEVENVTLERLDFDRETQDATNWHSAAENVGFATPGYENSQYYPTSMADDAVQVDPEVFSPNNDGYQDVLNINYAFDAPGFVANITIFDAKGRVVKYLTQSELLSTSGTISWDGTNETREKARIGIYVIYFEVFDLSGNVTKFKRSCVVAGQF